MKGRGRGSFLFQILDHGIQLFHFHSVSHAEIPAVPIGRSNLFLFIKKIQKSFIGIGFTASIQNFRVPIQLIFDKIRRLIPKFSELKIPRFKVKLQKYSTIKGALYGRVLFFTARCGNSATNQALLLKQFPLSLKGNALEWYMAIPPRSVADWDTMATTFFWAYYRPFPGIRRRFLSWERCLEISRPRREETRAMVGPVDEAIAILRLTETCAL